MTRLLEPWRTRVLWASLGLNLFCLALLAVPYMSHRRPSGPPSFDMIVGRIARDLPAADADTFRQAMGGQRPEFDAARERLAQSRAALAHSIAEQPFDPAATRAALTAMQDRLRDGASRFDDDLVTAMTELSPAGRTQLAETFRRSRR